jgi:hypothetical protein
MKNDGKKIEKLVYMIQETLKNSKGTQIFRNVKLDNKSNRKREIDVLIKSVINGFEILIAIECKDYNKPIPVEKIEAFNSKCLRMPKINKKVFVSTNGYQADAKEAAEDFNIELHCITDISPEIVTSWLAIKELSLKVTIYPFTIGLDVTQDEAEKLIIPDSLHINFYDGGEPAPIFCFVENILKTESRTIWSILTLDFMKSKKGEPRFKKRNIPYNIKLTGAFIYGHNQDKILVTRITSSIDAWLEESSATVKEAKALSNLDGVASARTVSVEVGSKDSVNLVLGAQSELHVYHTDEKGEINELVTLATYDPITDKLELATQI